MIPVKWSAISFWLLLKKNRIISLHNDNRHGLFRKRASRVAILKNNVVLILENYSLGLLFACLGSPTRVDIVLLLLNNSALF
jgi:hypothetical protein